jgi:hypothetical protein
VHGLGGGSLERDSFKWIPVEAPVTPNFLKIDLFYPVQMVLSEPEKV